MNKVMDTLKAHGFTETTTGGGCVAMRREYGASVYILATDDGGVEYPDPSDWGLGVYDDAREGEECLSLWSTSGVPFDQALAHAEAVAQSMADAKAKDAPQPSAPVVSTDAPQWQREFPDMPSDTFPAIPVGWEDTSWHNDVSPSFIAYRPNDENYQDALSVWIDFPDPSQREYPERPRFTVYRTEAEGEQTDCIAEGDDWEAILGAMLAYAMARPITTRAEAEAFIRALFDGDRFFHLDDDPADIINLATDEPTFTPAETALVRVRQSQIFALKCWTKDDCPHGVCLAYQRAHEERDARQTLEAFGFSVDIGGGGSAFMSRYFDGEADAPVWHIWATDTDGGQGFPLPHDYSICAYPPVEGGADLPAFSIRSDEMLTDGSYLSLADAAARVVAFVEAQKDDA